MTSGVYIRSEEHIEKVRQSHLGKKRSPETKEKMRQSKLGKKASLETKEKIRQNSIKYFSDPLQREKHRQAHIGKHWKVSEEGIKNIKQAQIKRFEDPNVREKLRQVLINRYKDPKEREKARKIRIKQIEANYGIAHPNYNPKACEYFKTFDEEHNTHGKYAIYGGGEHYIEDLGYFPDYINFDLKLIIEWDEEHHFENGVLRERDVRRQKEIQNLYQDFEFKRIREKEIV